MGHRKCYVADKLPPDPALDLAHDLRHGARTAPDIRNHKLFDKIMELAADFLESKVLTETRDEAAVWRLYCELAEEKLVETQRINSGLPIMVFMTDDDHGVCFGGRFHGLLMWRHPDGQFVSIRKLNPVDPTVEMPFADLVREGGSRG